VTTLVIIAGAKYWYWAIGESHIGLAQIVTKRIAFYYHELAADLSVLNYS